MFKRYTHVTEPPKRDIAPCDIARRIDGFLWEAK